MIDYLIVGSGLAGIAFSETALANDKTIFVIDSGFHCSSKVAAGLYNPVILKRFSKLWEAQEQLDLMIQFYENVEFKLGYKFNISMPILRKFFSVEEQNNWFIAMDRDGLSSFLSDVLVSEKVEGIDSPFGFGEVKQTGFVDVGSLLQKYQVYLLKHNSLLNEVFDFSCLKLLDGLVKYKQVEARHIIFAEGFGMLNNPFFNWLPLDGTKGELFIIKAPKLNLKVIVNTSVFILPLGNDLFKVGATYNWIDKSNAPTDQGRQELSERIKEILLCDFEIISHLAGVRPTVKDRKPLLGTHFKFNNVHILNGLGTRGVMLGPMMAKILYESIENGNIIEKSLNISRFMK